MNTHTWLGLVKTKIQLNVFTSCLRTNTFWWELWMITRIPLSEQFRHLHLQVPTNFTADQLIDMFFKLHHVLNLKYNPQLKHMLIFLERFVYGIKESDVPITLSKCAKKIMKDWPYPKLEFTVIAKDANILFIFRSNSHYSYSDYIRFEIIILRWLNYFEYIQDIAIIHIQYEENNWVEFNLNMKLNMK